MQHAIRLGKQEIVDKVAVPVNRLRADARLVRQQVIGLLADLRQRLGLSYVFITHDLPIVREFADRILVMQQGKVVEESDTEMLFNHPKHDYTKSLLNAVPRPKWA